MYNNPLHLLFGRCTLSVDCKDSLDGDKCHNCKYWEENPPRKSYFEPKKEE